jgi:hypothetical protein
MQQAQWRSGMHTEYLVGKTEGKMPLGRPGRKWDGNVKMAERNRMGLYGKDMDQWKAVINTVTKFRVP